MMKKFVRLLSVLLIVTMATPAFAITKTSIEKAAEYAEVLDFVKDNYIEDVSYEKLTDDAYYGLLSYLDEYSTYLTAEEFKMLEDSQKEEKYGIGILAHFYPKLCKIVEVYEGSAAEKAGVKVGDEITYINGAPYKDYDQFAEILAKPAGTTIRLAINRNGQEIIVSLKTGAYTAPTLYTKDLKDILNSENAVDTEKIRYMKIEGFDTGVSEKFATALSKGKKDGISVFIIDLRGNPGGMLEEIMFMFDEFIPRGNVVKIITRNEKPIILGSTYSGKTSPFKFVVLTDNISASASELFTATIKEKGVGKSVGLTTFGKGVGQDWVTLESGGMLSLTTFEYRTAKDTKVNGVGVSPDVKLDVPRYFTDYYFDFENDNHIKHINEILRYIGYKIDDINVYGQDTRNAVEDIQRAHKLYDSGYITGHELTAINYLLKNKLEPIDKNDDIFIKEAIKLAKTME